MVRMGASGARASTSGEQVSREKRNEGSAGLVSRPVSTDVPPAGDPAVELEPLPLVPVDPGRVVSSEEEEEEDAGPSLKRKRTVELGDLPPIPTGRAGKGKRSKGEGKAVALASGQWKPTITLSKDASVGDLEVARYLAERVTPPVDERALEKKSNLELGSQLVRLGMRVATGSFAVLQRLEALDQEVQDLHGQTKSLKDELSGIKEGRDLLQAKNVSLEEEREILLGRLARVEGEREMERKEKEVERKEREREVGEWKRTMRAERELIKGLLRERDRAVETLQEVRRSMKRQRIEAIKRWKRRFLYNESLELACDATLSVLQRGHQLYIPEGSSCPSFEDYARSLIPPTLGLSLEGMMKMVEGEPTEVPDEELDLSSEEEEPRVGDVLSSPSGPTSAPVVLLDEEELPSGHDLPAASLGPAPLPIEPPFSEASPEHPPAAAYSPGYTPSPPENT